MEYKKFVCMVEEKLNLKLEGGMKASKYSVVKNNGMEKTGMILESDEYNIAPAIYLEEFFEQYQKGMSIDRIVNEILEFYEKVKVEEDYDVSQLSLYENVKKKIAFKLVNTEKNQQMLKEVPHIPLLDLSIVFYILVDVDEKGSATIQIRNEHIEDWDVNVEQLYKDAKPNVKCLIPARLMCMQHVIEKLCDISKGEEKDLLKAKFPPENKEFMYILTNSIHQFGAAVLAYPNILEMASRIIGEDFYLLPSSIHEVILIPKSKSPDLKDLNEMINEVNETQVQEEEVLSDHAYYYEKNTHTLMMGKCLSEI
ncbi:hypothetical protein DW790_05065 [Firmicutes bacterium AM31-12AC]|nr:hypothetical protein DW790_05065 [Firmicutes bacterium AM31-12AC]